MILFGVVVTSIGINILYFLVGLLVKAKNYLKEKLSCQIKDVVKKGSNYIETIQQADST